jgi:hypothetical protein
VIQFTLNPKLESLIPADLKVKVSRAADSIAAGTLKPLPPT